MRPRIRLLTALLAACLPAIASAADVDAGNDFVEGDQVIYVDNFAKVPPGMVPRNLTLTEGNLEVARVGDRSVLRVTADTTHFSLRLPSVLPERFTIEMDMDLPPALGWDQAIYLRPPMDTERDARLVHWDSEAGIQDRSGETERRFMSSVPRAEEAGDADEEAVRAPRWDRFQVMGDGNFVKVYVNGTRVANVPNVDLGRSNALHFAIRGDQKYPVLIGGIRVAAGGKDLYRALMEDGQVTLEGIEFDTGSDALRPASDAVLQSVAGVLKDKSDVVVVVQGHTDNAGNAAANQTLSDRRAKAVVTRLASLGVPAGQLKSEGLGATQPVASNETAEGRQRNRRVMLLRDF